MTRLFAAALALLFAIPPGHAIEQQEELLEPDAAFSLSTRVIDAHTLEASWKIAEGYYMYRDKFKFESLDKGIALKPPVIPPGKKKTDPYFGTVETYVNAVAIRLPITRTRADAHATRLRITAQGCNEPIGVCYAPIVKEAAFTLPAVTAAGAPQIIGSLKELNQLIDPAGQREFLEPDKAFQLSIEPAGGNALLARFVIAEGYYLYRDKTRFKLGGPAGGLRLAPYQLPRGEITVDEIIGETEVYYRYLEIKLSLAEMPEGNQAAVLRASYQGCAVKGICYPPTTREFDVTWSNGVLAVGGMTAAPATDAEKGAQERALAGFIATMLAAFGAGLLLTFTPCVLPLVPILSSIIIGQGDRNITKLKGGLLALSYVLGTSVTYTAAGILAGATGEQLQAYFQNVWAIGVASLIFILLALSMFGFYEIHIPAFIQSRLHHHSRRIKGGNFAGVFVLGLLSALIIGACVSPILIGALSGAIASRDPALGGAIMFSMSLGMGVLLIAIGVGAGCLLPRAGPWMNRVKQVFGVLLLAVAVYLLGFLPEVPVLLLWAALLIVSAVYLGATQGLPEGAGGWRYLWKGVGTVLLVWGLLALLGGLAGNRDILNPLPQLPAGIGLRGEGPGASEIKFETIMTLRDLEDRLAAARAAGQPAIVDYYASWCPDCLRMEKTTFADPRVRRALRGFVLLKPDVTDSYSPESKAMKQKFGVFGPPATLFFSVDGKERKDLRFYGYRPADEFLEIVNSL